MSYTVLYRPVNQHELKLIEAAQWKRFPPRLPGQPIFYPVLNEEYATQIAQEWNVPTYGEGYVLQFKVDQAYCSRFEIQTVGLDMHQELWVPAEELDEFNDHIIGEIKITQKFFKNK